MHDPIVPSGGHGCQGGAVAEPYTDSAELPSAFVLDLCPECDAEWWATHVTEAEQDRCREANGGRRDVTCTGRCARGGAR